jgi:hypothetical protein
MEKATRRFLAGDMGFNEWHPRMMTAIRHAHTKRCAELKKMFWEAVEEFEIINPDY